MSKFSDNLTAQRKKLRMTVPDVVAELEKRGVIRAEPSVAQWFNGIRGSRIDMDDLKALLDVLQTSFEEMAEGEVDLVEEKDMRKTLRDIKDLSPEKRQLVQALVQSMKDK